MALSGRVWAIPADFPAVAEQMYSFRIRVSSTTPASTPHAVRRFLGISKDLTALSRVVFQPNGDKPLMIVPRFDTSNSKDSAKHPAQDRGWKASNAACWAHCGTSDHTFPCFQLFKGRLELAPSNNRLRSIHKSQSERPRRLACPCATHATARALQSLDLAHLEKSILSLPRFSSS